MDAATIEETNRIRISLGMKPLPVPGASQSKIEKPAAAKSDNEEDAPSTLESRQAQAYDNFKKVQDAEQAKKLRDERAAAVRRAREKAQRFALLDGKGLGEANGDDEQDAKAWLLGQKKRQKKIDKSRKMEQELAAAEAAAAAATQYTAKDLAGIKVAHDSTSFLDGDEQILTLKDATIEENEEEGDELENMDIRDKEKLAERLDLKKKTKGYNPNDYEDGGLLAQYDEEINGKKAKKFTLDDDGAIAELGDILDQPVRKGNKLKTIDLDDIMVGDTTPSSDYLAATEIKVKKPKKKKSKTTRQKPVDEDDIFPTEIKQEDDGAMDVDSKDGLMAIKRKADADVFVDDDDLQASLAIQRKNALKKRKKMRPEDIAKQLKEEDESGSVVDEAQNGGLVIGEISEFVAGLSKHDDSDERKPKRQKQPTQSPGADEDEEMGDEEEQDLDMERVEEAVPSTINGEEEGDEREEEEKAVGQGMGATLALLRERGLVEDADGAGQFKNFREREEFLRRKRVLEEELDEQTRQQRERDRSNGKLDRMSTREREEWARQQNTWRDHQQSKRMAELFQAGYKPSVELRYVDEHGRRLDQKEAFKHLSHQFHGKGSGKGKTEKRLKKIDDEKRRDAQSMFDGQGAGMNLATAQQLKKRKEAGVRLG